MAPNSKTKRAAKTSKPQPSPPSPAPSPSPSRTSAASSPEPEPEPDVDADSAADASHPDTSIDPYTTLCIPRSSQPPEIRKAYHTLALKHHPDKVPAHEKSSAHRTFQRIALAYAVLSDPARRARYDATGSTSESLFDSASGKGEDGAFDWLAFYRQLFDRAAQKEAMQAFEVQYRHGPEERADLLRAFEAGEGDLDRVYESVMLSNVLDDDERFRGVLEEAIKSGEVTAWDAYVNEPEAKRMKRRNRAEREAKEAAQWVKEDEAKRAQKKERLGLLNEKAGPRNKASRERSSMQELAAAIGGRQIARQGAGGFLERLEEKYAKPTRARAKKGEVTHKMKRKEAAMQKKKNGLLSHGGGFRVKDPEEEDDVKGKKGKKRRRDPGVEEEEADGDVWEGTDGEDDGPAAGEPDEDAFMQTQKRMLADSEARREKRESGADQKTESGVAGKGKGKGKSRAKKRKTAAS